MLTREEMNAIFDRILAGQATEADIYALRLELQQGKYRIEAEQLNANEIHIGDRIYQGADAETIKAVLQSALSEQQKILEQQKAKRSRIERDFLGMMKAEVVDSLKQSLHHAVLMNLGKEEQPEQVERLWDAKIKVADQPNVLLPNDTKTIEVFDREDIAGRLLILGSPGSGKTTTLLELAKVLIERAEMERDFPMPVLFNLSSWKDDKQPLYEWMVQELKLRGCFIARKWLDSHKLLPLLDGLDEMASDRQETCVKAINQQLLSGEKSLPYLVICSRNEEYDNYETKLLLNGAIFIQALTIEKIRHYLNSIDQFELCQTLDHDVELLTLVRTPLFLSIAALSFRRISSAGWQSLITTEARIEYLLDAYIRQMMGRTIHNNPYRKQRSPTNQKTQKWLTWLAQQMQRKSQTEFLIERMQPSFLLNKSRLQTYKLGVGLMSGTIFGTVLFCLTYAFDVFREPKLVTATIVFYTLINGLIFAVTSGLACSISSVMRPFEFRQIKVEVRHRAFSGLIFGALFSLYFLWYYSWHPYSSLTSGNISFGTTINANNSNIDFITGVAFLSLVSGVTGSLIKGVRAEIVTFESLQWSLAKAKNRFALETVSSLRSIRFGLRIIITRSWIVGLTCFILIGFMDSFTISFIFGILCSFGLIAFFAWLAVMLAVSLLSGLEGKDVERKSTPNQGIKRSLSISVFFGFLGVLINLLFTMLCNLLATNLLSSKNGVAALLLLLGLSLVSLSLLVSVPMLVQTCGGAACIQHCVLRLILHHSDYIPWNYARFLNYCTERSLLQRVGGRYRFIHRLLQEHFAAMPFDGIEGDRQRSTP